MIAGFSCAGLQYDVVFFLIFPAVFVPIAVINAIDICPGFVINTCCCHVRPFPRQTGPAAVSFDACLESNPRIPLSCQNQTGVRGKRTTLENRADQTAHQSHRCLSSYWIYISKIRAMLACKFSAILEHDSNGTWEMRGAIRFSIVSAGIELATS